MTTFTSLGLTPEREAQLARHQITTPSPVQASAIPPLLAGKDALIQSQTGSGKTLAYLLPMLARLDPDKPGVQGLVLVPTQELGIQVRDVAKLLLEGTGMTVAVLIGGANFARQAEALNKGPKIVVGTPGRIVDFMIKRRLDLTKVRTTVVDEADQLFDEGNAASVEKVLKGTPPSGQRAFVSATLGTQATAWAEKLMKSPEKLLVVPETTLPETLKHVAFLVDKREKIEYVRRLVRHYNPVGALAFVRKGEEIDWLVEKLKFHQMRVAGLHGGMGKKERTEAMRDFKAGKLQLLVCTELAARGLDLSGVSLVLNWELPPDPQGYTHRVGRTARMGREGTAITLADPKEAFVLNKLEKALAITFERPVFAHGEVREKTEKDARKEKLREKAKVKKATEKDERKAAAEASGRKLTKPKKVKEKGPTEKAVSKGKARKAKRKAVGAFKPAAKPQGAEKPQRAPRPEAPPATEP